MNLLNRILLFILLMTVSFLNSCQSEKEQISYNEHIRPIFNAKCLACHGGVKKMGGFSLLFEHEALDTTDSGIRAIIPGNHRKSELFKRIVHEDPELRMPQDAAPLTNPEIELIKKWIDQGAKWEDHWAYLPPEEPTIPKHTDPWIRHEMDQFVYQKLKEQSLEPSTEADQATLIRRLSLDLIGLPPSPEEVDVFTKDDAPDAYEKLVDRLLASPHFGERWASMWLDLARYADSKGYEKDPYRSIWKYRDWVIDAFNQDKPFDQFTIEQIAGDLLPDPTNDQLIATAFHRNTMTNTEGGTDDEEYRVIALLDRVNTTFEVWQGITMSCVQCHSHPYDPFVHEEYYESMAFFNNTLDNDIETDFPLLETYTSSDSTEIQEVIQFIKDLNPAFQIPENKKLDHQIKGALFPRLFPQDIDDIQHVMITGGGEVGNGSYNAKAGEGRRYFFKYDQIALDGLKEIDITYFSEGSDAKVEIHQGSPDGPFLGAAVFAQTWGPPLKKAKNDDRRATISIPINEVSGTHDLVFEIINTTGKAPEGIVWVKELFLRYADFDTPLAWKEKTDQLLSLRRKAQRTPVMQPKSTTFRRPTHIFERGNWLALGKEVTPKIPNTLPQITARESPNRLDFARWLVEDDHPLTARVAVNRFWEQLFGQGLVATLEDFGTQGQAPSHPELLDFLALRFSQDYDWSVKKLLRSIVLSATYRQSSSVTAQKLEKDPYNVLLARGPRFRLSAEQLRDQALAVSGLLRDTIGGHSVMPPQPEGVWQLVYSSERWTTKPEDRYRRGLYTFWKRTTPYPSMVAFDSPSREFCVSRRIRTNTPLQALVTLNDPVYMEAAQALAGIMEQEKQLENSIIVGYQRALVSVPDQETIRLLSDLYKKAEVELVDGHHSDTEIILNPMTIVASAIMNLDAFLTKT